MTVYAIGDIHGCEELLYDLVQQIRNDMDDGPHKLIFLGDYVDRGPDSAGVVDLIIALQKDFYGRDDVSVIALKGNHEQMMIDFYEGGDWGSSWMMNGGVATQNSYSDFSKGKLQLHIDWMKSRPLSHIHEKWIFVHAGINPCVGMDEQLPQELLWIREDFLRYKGYYFGYTVVHGHTPTTYWSKSTNPDVFHSRIGIDTGAEHSGVLTAIKITKDNRFRQGYSFIQAKDEGKYAQFYEKYVKRWEETKSGLIVPKKLDDNF